MVTASLAQSHGLQPSAAHHIVAIGPITYKKAEFIIRYYTKYQHLRSPSAYSLLVFVPPL